MSSPALGARWLVAVALVATALVVVANWPTFAFAADPDRAEGNRIMATFRIPNHSQPGTWFGLETVVVLACIVAAVALALRSRAVEERRLGVFLAAATGLIVTASVAVAIVRDPSLELLFPWRASVVVVPLATNYLVARVSRGIVGLGTRFGVVWLVAGVAGLVLAGSVVSGVRATRAAFSDRPSRDEVVLAVREAHPAGEGLIPTDLEDVRLNARVPVYVDLGNPPHEPAEIVAWRQRLREADRAMADDDAPCALVRAHRFGWVLYPEDLTDGAPPACVAGWEASPVGDLVLVVRPAGT